jgi:diguanylate cyclase (GGDEF)-like protein
MSQADRYGHDSSVVYIDLNDFKEINDTYGHSAGDKALKHVADVILANIRDSDVVGRFGGDEFGIILDKSNADKAREKAEMLRRAILSSPRVWNDTRIDVHVAFGVYTFSGTEDAGHALAAADRDMYAHKRVTKGI